MKNKIKLTKKQKDRFQTVVTIIFTNPFSTTRIDHEKEIINQVDDELNHNDRRRLLFQTVHEQFKLTGGTHLDQFELADKGMIKDVYLFLIYHQYTDEFDQLIQSHINHPSPTLHVPFSSAIMTDILSFGIDNDDAVHYVALFFQIRRAFYFIYYYIIGDNNEVNQCRKQLWNSIFTHNLKQYADGLYKKMEDFSTLLLGETGTGKGLAAAAIGQSSYIPFNPQREQFEASFNRSFYSVNLSEIPESLLESELFGYSKGAFTGADTNRAGILNQTTKYGAIFLDEIGDVSIQTQIKLLNVLQQRTFSPVGSHEKHTFSGRIIAATHQPLNERIKQGQFREDFYYRLSSDVIILPSLNAQWQDNPNDIPNLVSHVVKKVLGYHCKETCDQAEKQIHALTMDYPWPGNVRELEQCIRRILIKGYYKPMEVQRHNPIEALTRTKQSAERIIVSYCKALFKSNNYQGVAKITGLDWRTVKKYVNRLD